MSDSPAATAKDSSLSPQHQEAEKIKNEANKFFQDGKYEKAIDLYTQAIELNSNNAIYYANRSFAYAKKEQYGAAIEDASKSIELDKTYAKGYYRRGNAKIALGKHKEALKDFKQVVKIYPSNKEARDKLQQCEKIIRKMAFEDAISFNETPVSQTIDADSIAIDASYDGPHLDEVISLDFVKNLIAHLKSQKKLHLKYVYKMLLQMKDLLCRLDSLISIQVPAGSHFNVCGDVHGQYYDLLNIFEKNGLPSEDNPYLFNGDFVDRGSFSVEVILTLFALKLLYPKHMHLLRGNHETINMNVMYGFKGEVESKYGKTCFELFTEVFNWLPLSAVINDKVIVLHGGLFSQDNVSLEDIKKINRNRQPGDEGLMVDLLWSDPQPYPGRGINKRGVGVSFGPDITHAFLKYNNLELLIRSHEVKEEGYLVEAEGKLITVFSAPNYCDQAGNKGAIVKLNSDMKPSFVTFAAVPHPDVKPLAYASQYSQFVM